MGIRTGSVMLARRIDPDSVETLKRLSKRIGESESRTLDLVLKFAGRHTRDLKAMAIKRRYGRRKES